MDEYEIEDSMKCTPNFNNKEEETFINSQDFNFTQEDNLTQEIKNYKENENSQMKNNTQENENSQKYNNTQENFKNNTQEDSSEIISDDSSSEDFIPVRRSKKNKNTPKKTKIISKKKKEEISTLSCEDKKKQKKDKKKLKITNEDKTDIKKSKSTNEDISDNKYNLNPNDLKIFNFLYNINRPVSSTELALNFKGQLTASVLQTICTDLENKSLISIKVYSKSKIYMVNPNVFDMNKSEEYKLELSNLVKENEELKNTFQNINLELKSLKSMDTEEELDKKIEDQLNKIKEIELRYKLRDEGLLVTKKEVEEYNNNIKKKNKIYKQRTKIVNEILGMLCENMNIKKKELIEAMELDM